MSFLIGVWPPEKKGVFYYLRALHILINTHKATYTAIKKILPHAQIGLAKNNTYFEAYQNTLINRVLKRMADWWVNYYFLNRIRGYQDFIGLNYYFHNRIDYGFYKNENKHVSDMGLWEHVWELYPEGLYYALKELAPYRLPIYITEHGLADREDTSRAWYITESLKSVARALQEGVDVRGYLHWSLLDNFEWNKGFWPRFGLVEVDYQTKTRTIRKSALVFKEVCITNKIEL